MKYNIVITTMTSRDGLLASGEIARLKMPYGDITLAPSTDSEGYITNMSIFDLSPAVIISLMKMVEDSRIYWVNITDSNDASVLNFGNDAMELVLEDPWH